MEKKISITRIKKNLRASDFFLQCGLPMGYKAGFPILQIRNDSLCLLIPFLRYQTTGEVDKTRVYPIRYTITLELPTEKVVGFANLEYDPVFGSIDFDKPVGYFRHESIRQYDKAQYEALYEELMQEYEKVAEALLFGGAYGPEDEARMRELLQLLAEPSLLPVYRALDMDFYNKYLRKG